MTISAMQAHWIFLPGKLDRKALHLKAETEAKLDNNDRHQ
jgi:hypothetical protein